MSTNRTKLIATVSLSILLCVFGCVGMAKLAQKGSEGNLPIRRLLITIDVSQREQLFDQLQKFAAKHDFRLLIRKVEVIPDGIFIEMYREDLEILASDIPKAPTMIDFGIYERSPSHSTPEETVDDLLVDLKSFISEIPNVKIIEEK